MPREMKDSGIEWIGEIPREWKLRRLRYMCNILTGNQDTQDNNPDGEYPFYVRSPIVERSNSFTFEGPAILMAGDGAGAGKVFHYVDGKYGCHQRVYSIQKIKGINRKLLYYYLKNNFYIMIDTANSKSTVDSVRLIMLQDFHVPIPSEDEQNKIAAYLDIECAKIDDVITKTKATIEEYKKLKQSVITEAVTKGIRPNREMKDSGIEWIGEIPTEWNVVRVKNLFDYRNEKNFKPLNEVNLISLYTDLGVVQHCDLEATTGNKASNADGYKLVFEDDIVVNIILCWMGAIGRSAYTGVTSPAYDVYSPKAGTNSKFYHHLFRTQGFNGDCYKVGRGIMAMRWRTYSDQFRAIKVVAPPKSEQEEIVAYLDKKCSEIDTLIARKEQIVTELESYKKSLIYEYVTGKREVSDMNEKEETITIFDPQATRLMQEALAYKVIKHSGDDLKGRIHLMKMIFILDIMLGLNLGINYLRYNHGPYNPIIESIEKNLSDKGIISVNTAKNYSYTVIDDSFDSKYNELFAKHNSEIEKIIDYMKRMKSSRAEKIATLYAAWNDMVIDGVQNITDKMIIDDVMNNWTENKAKTDFSTWQHILNDMKDKKIIPHGYGKHTRPRSE